MKKVSPVNSLSVLLKPPSVRGSAQLPCWYQGRSPKEWKGCKVFMLLPFTVSRRTLPRPEGRWNPSVGACLGPYDSPTAGVGLGLYGPRRKHFLMSEETVPTGKTNACLWSLGDFPSLHHNSRLPRYPSLVQCTSLGTDPGLLKRSVIWESPLVDAM
jgi:hypothetical protein